MSQNETPSLEQIINLPSTLHVKLPRASTPSRRGRSLVAARSFPPGSLIATFTNPLIAITGSPSLENTCSWCLASRSSGLPGPARKLSACSGCKTAYYCSQKCQKQDWSEKGVDAEGRGFHKLECRAFRRIAKAGYPPRSYPTPNRALMRLLLAGGGKRGEVKAGLVKDAVDELQTHAEGWLERGEENQGEMSKLSEFKMQALATISYLGWTENGTEEVDLDKAIHGLFKIQINSFNRLDADADQTGLYLHPALALANHSCLPNAFVQFSGRHAILRAYREIKKGEEVEISYINQGQLRAQRQDALLNRYHFRCTCPRCHDDLDVYQAAKLYPHLHLNALSLVASPALFFSDPPASSPLAKLPAIETNILKISPQCTQPEVSTSLTQLHHRWRLTAPLRAKRLFTLEPVTAVLKELSIYFATSLDDYPSSLAVACLLSTQVDPWRGPMPFENHRMKGLVMLMRSLGDVAMRFHSGESLVPPQSSLAYPVRKRLRDALAHMDLVTMSQALASIVAHWAPQAHSEQWYVCAEARDMVAELESLPDRGQISSLIRMWVKDPEEKRGPQSEMARLFIEETVLKSTAELAGFAEELSDAMFSQELRES